MLPKKAVTLSDIAKRANVSVMTVSRALRNQANISPSTQQRIRQIANELGYRPNPLVSALMTYRRAAKPVKAHLNLAFLTDYPTRDGWKAIRLFEEFYEGVAEAADRHGYGTDVFWMREPGMTPERVNQILSTRSIHGLLIAPLPRAHGHLHLDWEKFSAVTFGYSLEQPQLHRAANHQYRSMRLMVRELRALGYTRLGLALPAALNERVEMKWTAGLLVEHLDAEAAQRVAPFIVDDAEWSFHNFRRWFERQKPDVILTHDETALGWLRTMKVRVPEDVGFAHLNLYDKSGQFAGIYQNGPAIGMAAADMLIAMINRNERGIPTLPHSLVIDGTWVPGATLRPQKRRAG
jgi:DNA-binding LacI/PurR family transcriptional regulator